MKKIFILIFFTQFTYCQSETEHQIVGIWNVVNVSNTGINQAVSDENEMTKIFLHGKINFRSDGVFKLNLKSQHEFAAELAEMTAGTKWIFDKETGWIMVGNKADEYSIIGFEYSKKNNDTYLKIPESGIVLRVEKTK